MKCLIALNTSVPSSKMGNSKLKRKLVDLSKHNMVSLLVGFFNLEKKAAFYVHTRNPVSAPAAPDLLARPAGGLSASRAMVRFARW